MENPNICRHFEVSAKSGENVEKVFIDICKILIGKKKDKKSLSPQPRPNNPHAKNTEIRKAGQSESERKKCCG